jgi:hypothetical protein
MANMNCWMYGVSVLKHAGLRLKSPAQELPHTGYATGFHCPTHGKFKVADTIFPEDYTRQQWVVALKKAQLRTKQGEWPLVRHGDF